jgi:uncharacterized membrane protein YebE (DUF533 family)
MKRVLFVLFAVLLFMSFNVYSKGHHGDQAQRVKQGIKSGQITPEEAKELKTKHQEIQNMKKEAKSDGSVTVEEKKKIKEARKELSKDIYEQKHDSETVNK